LIIVHSVHPKLFAVFHSLATIGEDLVCNRNLKLSEEQMLEDINRTIRETPNFNFIFDRVEDLAASSSSLGHSYLFDHASHAVYLLLLPLRLAIKQLTSIILNTFLALSSN
jgi:hypothetical protein